MEYLQQVVSDLVCCLTLDDCGGRAGGEECLRTAVISRVSLPPVLVSGGPVSSHRSIFVELLVMKCRRGRFLPDGMLAKTLRPRRRQQV